MPLDFRLEDSIDFLISFIETYSPADMDSPSYAYFLTQAGVHTLENFNLKKLSDDAVDLSCVMILPLMVKGSSASSIRPVAIGPSTL